MTFILGFLIGYCLGCWIWAWVAVQHCEVDDGDLHHELLHQVVTFLWPLIWPVQYGSLKEIE